MCPRGCRVGDSVAVSVPWLRAPAPTGVAVAPPLMSLPDGCNSKSPTWFVRVLDLYRDRERWSLSPMVVDADIGRPVSLTGASRLYETAPVTVWENTVPSVVAALHHVDLPQAWLWDRGTISEAFPVGLSGVGVVSMAVTSMFPDSVTRRLEVGWREQVVVHRVVGGVVPARTTTRRRSFAPLGTST